MFIKSKIMETRKLLLGMAVIALGLSSCKDEKKIQAEKSVETYVVYVDSLGNMDSVATKENWESIQANYELRNAQAEAALADLKDDIKAQERINASRAKYDELKARMDAQADAENKATIADNPKQRLRNALFGEGKVGDDMNFNWVNAQNILNVYQLFVDTAQKNKDSYTREDWDEVKLMYEALDSRKNTVEKEGLTSSDNRKISGLKLKFAPMYTLNRMGAKSDEMSKAKK
jgi:type IV secretory pathway TrbF-like protein